MTTNVLSSCECRKCDNPNQTSSVKGIKSNTGLGNCKIGTVLTCKGEETFKYSAEPGLYSTTRTFINPDVYSKKRVRNFKKGIFEGKNVYTNIDPRLYTSTRDMTTMLDAPPISGKVPLSTIGTDPSLDQYGVGYKTYSDINAGQIIYHTNDSDIETYFSPLFANTADAVGTLYKDPMDNVKPQYERKVPDVCYSNPASEKNPIDMASRFQCLSWITDTQAHREDLLSKQMQKINRTSWSSRWE